MSIFTNFTKRNSLIKTLQFRLKPVYGTEEKLRELGLLEKDRERSESWPVVLEILRRLDAQFLEKALSGVELDWRPLANFEKHDALLRKQAEMRKMVVKLLTSQPEYKDLMNPTKAIKMAAETAEHEDKERAVAKFARFTTVLVDYFTLKKALFSAEEKKSTIAYRIVQVNFPIFLDNLSSLKKYAEASLYFSDKFPSLEVNEYNKYLIQSQIDKYNQNIGQINQILQKLYAQHKLPQALKGLPLKLKLLQNQVLGGKENKTEGFTEYTQIREAVWALRSTVLDILDVLSAAFEQNANLEVLAKYQEIETAVRESSHMMFFQDQDSNSVVSIKAFLDAVLGLRRMLKVLLSDGVEYGDKVKDKLLMASDNVKEQQELPKIIKESNEYADLYKVSKGSNAQENLLSTSAEAWQQLESMPALYNQVRYFLTRKPYKKDKIRLFFDCAAFGKGWDVNKEKDYLLTLFRKQGLYYLGIRRRGAVIDFDKLACEGESSDFLNNCYEKMVYKSFDFVKGMPAVLFSKMILQKFSEGAAEVVLDNSLFSRSMDITKADFEQKYRVVDGSLQELESDEIKYLKQYLLKTRDEAGYLAAVHQRIDLAKRFIASYKAFEFFDMSQLKPTDEYTSWTDFLLHVNKFTYGLRWQKLPELGLKQLVEAGDLFLFQLDNQDFALARENEDEQTQLLRNLFSERNQREQVLKLLGGVEVYYRPASIKENKKLMHAKGSILVNKKDSTHAALDAALVRNAYKYLNGKSKTLLPEAEALLKSGRITFKEAARDIIKDKRYTEDQMLVHFPIALNYRCSSRDYDINKDIRSLLKNNPAVHILGVHLGGDNLAEITIMDQEGKLIIQKVYNEFNEYNYLQALHLKEEQRVEAQRNWLQMEKLKHLKDGYLASLVNEICQLLLQHNAIIVLEDYRKSKGKAVQAQHIHMQLALKLVHKLNYLTIKGKAPLEPGGLLNAYQLAPKVESLAGFANQIGIVFFVLPNYDRAELGENCSGAQAVALKGLLLLKRINAAQSLDKVDLMLTKAAWHSFLEERGLTS